MIRFVLFLVLLISCTNDLSAMGVSPLVRDSSKCDILVMNDGTEINIHVVLIDATSIQYKPCENQDGPLYVIPQKVAFMVKYRNGSKDVFPLVKDSPRQSQPQPKTGVMEGFGVASFIFSLGALLIPTNVIGVSLVLTLFAFMFSMISFKRIENSKGKFKHRAWAVLGLIFSLIAAIAIFIVVKK